MAGIFLCMATMTESTFWILTALAAGRQHGYAIMRDVERLSGGTATLRATTLYAALERLEREQRIQKAGDEIVDGRARRSYELTPQGHHDLVAETEALAARAQVAATALKRGPSPAVRPSPALRLGRAW